MHKVSVYALTDPRNDSIWYIGISDNPHRRLLQHLTCTSGCPERIDWIIELEEAGLKPVVKIIEEGLTRKEAEERETYWLRHYFNLHEPLTNDVKLRQMRFEAKYPESRERWLPVYEIARRLKTPATLIYTLASSGKIRSEQDAIGSATLVELNEAKALLQEIMTNGPLDA